MALASAASPSVLPAHEKPCVQSTIELRLPSESSGMNLSGDGDTSMNFSGMNFNGIWPSTDVERSMNLSGMNLSGDTERSMNLRGMNLSGESVSGDVDAS